MLRPTHVFFIHRGHKNKSNIRKVKVKKKVKRTFDYTRKTAKAIIMSFLLVVAIDFFSYPCNCCCSCRTAINHIKCLTIVNNFDKYYIVTCIFCFPFVLVCFFFCDSFFPPPFVQYTNILIVYSVFYTCACVFRSTSTKGIMSHTYTHTIKGKGKTKHKKKKDMRKGKKTASINMSNGRDVRERPLVKYLLLFRKIELKNRIKNRK